MPSITAVDALVGDMSVYLRGPSFDDANTAGICRADRTSSA
jgi:hypothetical protein